MRGLDEARVGETVVVQAIKVKGELKRRLMDMGVTVGTQLYVRKTAPLGDPVEVSLRNYEISIRKEDGRNIHID